MPLNIPITDIPAAFTPLFAACILTYNKKGEKGVLKLLSRIFNYKKLHFKWWLVILILPILIFSFMYYLLQINNYAIPDKWTTSISSIPVLLIFLFLGAMGEELGYAVDPLQKTFSVFWTSIIIEVPWIVWHQPSVL